jgi:hypothetical protein
MGIRRAECQMFTKEEVEEVKRRAQVEKEGKEGKEGRGLQEEEDKPSLSRRECQMFTAKEIEEVKRRAEEGKESEQNKLQPGDDVLVQLESGKKIKAKVRGIRKAEEAKDDLYELEYTDDKGVTIHDAAKRQYLEKHKT